MIQSINLLSPSLFQLCLRGNESKQQGENLKKEPDTVIILVIVQHDESYAAGNYEGRHPPLVEFVYALQARILWCIRKGHNHRSPELWKILMNNRFLSGEVYNNDLHSLFRSTPGCFSDISTKVTFNLWKSSLNRLLSKQDTLEYWEESQR